MKRIAGKLGGCPFSIVEGDHPDDQKYECLQCGMESLPHRDAFLESRLLHCERVRDKAKPPTPAPVELAAEVEAEAPKKKSPKKKSQRQESD